MQMTKINVTDSAILGIYRLLIVFFIIFTLYFAQTILIPLTLAALLTFLLSPLVTTLEKWIGRIFSILIVVVISFSIIGLVGYLFANQIILFGSNFENYYANIQKKLQALSQSEVIVRFQHVFGNIKENLLENSAPGTKERAVEVKTIDFSSSFTGIATWLSISLINLIGSIGIIFLLVIFMLHNREDIRSRIIKLLGQHQISSTTSTMDDASERVREYIFRQLTVNIGFGLCVIAGLYLIGIPNAFLWGCLASILRFIPYIGVWIASILPIAISFIITDTWITPFLTISFFITLEIITAYIIEPFYYGLTMGVSPFALILAAIFWTWLWGPIGLLLSTPLTVCLVVLGQHITNMNFLTILLSHEKPLTPAEECYHRLLSLDTGATMDVLESYLKNNSIISLYDSVLIPVIIQTERDLNQGLIDSEKKDNVHQSIREILELLSISISKESVESKEAVESNEPVNVSKGKILCLPGRTIRDELGANILTQLLIQKSFDAEQMTSHKLDDILELVKKNKIDAICIVVIAPAALSHTRYLCANLHQRNPQLPIIINLWGFSQISNEVLDNLNSAGATKIVYSLAESFEVLQKMDLSRIDLLKIPPVNHS